MRDFDNSIPTLLIRICRALCSFLWSCWASFTQRQRVWSWAHLSVSCTINAPLEVCGMITRMARTRAGQLIRAVWMITDVLRQNANSPIQSPTQWSLSAPIPRWGVPKSHAEESRGRQCFVLLHAGSCSFGQRLNCHLCSLHLWYYYGFIVKL